MSESHDPTRRHFLKNMALGAGGMAFVGSFGFLYTFGGPANNTLKGIIVDFTKCTGCRTCETVCSASNNRVEVDGEMLPGLGNPWLANIKVHWYNPDVDVAMVCSRCADAPCIKACPVPPDLVTGHKALYHHPELGTVRNDAERCIGCGQCAKACRSQRTGVISQHADGKPFGMCSLCGGYTQCVKNCSYDALKYVEYEGRGVRGMSPDAIARKLIWEFYEIEV